MKTITNFEALEGAIDAYKKLIEWTEDFKEWLVEKYYGESLELNKFAKDILNLCDKRENRYVKNLNVISKLYDSYNQIKPICEENNFNFHEYFNKNERDNVIKILDVLDYDLNQFNEFIQVWDTKNTHRNNLLKEKEKILN